MIDLLKLYEFLKDGNLSPTTCLFVTFIVLGAVIAKVYIGPPK